MKLTYHDYVYFFIPNFSSIFFFCLQKWASINLCDIKTSTASLGHMQHIHVVLGFFRVIQLE